MKISPFTRWIGLGIAVPGILVCLVALVSFVVTIKRNALAVGPDQLFFQEHYLAVGRAYSQAFAVGFFFCFFLILVAVISASWVDQWRRARAGASHA